MVDKCEADLPPFVALGDCVRWDTVCSQGEYKIEEDSNVAAIETIKQLKVDIAWSSNMHGETIVCFENIRQLKHALKENMLKGWGVFSK